MSWRTLGKRGDVLENLLELSNDFYRKNKIARVEKAATPVTVTEISENGQIKKAYFEKKSTVDYYGIVQGIYIAFDAKETNQKSFPLKNIHEHQVEYMRDVDMQGGLSFLIINFKLYDKYIFMPFEILSKFYDASLRGGRKSIPFDAIDERFYIEFKGNLMIPYLDMINVYIDYKKELKDN